MAQCAGASRGPTDIRRFFRGDAAFANPNLYTFLEEEDFLYAIRLPGNQNLQRAIEHLLTRPIGRPSRAPKVFYESFTYQAKSWDTARRVVAKVEWHQGELFPRVGFIVTNLSRSEARVVKFYNGRGAIVAAAFGLAAAAAEKPNIIVIYGDDIGYGDFSCYGGT